MVCDLSQLYWFVTATPFKRLSKQWAQASSDQAGWPGGDSPGYQFMNYTEAVKSLLDTEEH